MHIAFASAIVATTPATPVVVVGAVALRRAARGARWQRQVNASRVSSLASCTHLEIFYMIARLYTCAPGALTAPARGERFASSLVKLLDV